MNWKRTCCIVLGVVVVGAGLAGCGASLLQQRGIEFTESTDPNILRIVHPDEGGTYKRGEVLPIEWVSTLGPTDVDVELYEAGSYERSVTVDLKSPTYDWRIPEDLPLSTEYQIVVSAYHPQQGSGELLLTAYSDVFAVVTVDAE
jgi:hypothetical protein